MKSRFRKRLMFWMWDWPDWVPFCIEDVATWAACRIWGHEPQPDCGDPNHDSCTWCMKSMPGEAPRRAAS